MGQFRGQNGTAAISDLAFAHGAGAGTAAGGRQKNFISGQGRQQCGIAGNRQRILFVIVDGNGMGALGGDFGFHKQQHKHKDDDHTGKDRQADKVNHCVLLEKSRG